MRIERIDFERVGRWHDRELAFGPGLNIVWGENEAGKSTARRAIEALLFPAESGDKPWQLGALVAPLKPREFAATLHAARELDGVEERISWRRQSGRLSDLTGKPVPEAVLRAWLWEISQQDFRAVYSLGHDGLRDGAQLLGRDGALGRILLDLASGGRDVNRVRAELAESLESQYSAAKNARNQAFNRQLAEVQKLTDELKELERLRNYDVFRSAVAQREECLAKRAEAEAALLRARALVGELNRIGFAPPVIDAVRAAEEELAGLRASGPVPSRDWRRGLSSRREALAKAAQEVESARADEASARVALEGRTRSGALLAHESSLREVIGRRSFLSTYDEDLETLRRSADGALDQFAGALRPLGVDVARDELLARAGDFELDAPSRRELLSLRRAQVEAAAEVADAERHVRDAEERCEEAREELAQLAPAKDVEELRGQQQLGALAAQEHELAAKREALEKTRGRLEAAAGRLGFVRPADLQACASTRVPGEQEAGAVVADWQKAKSAVVEAEARCRELAKAVQADAERCRALEAHVPASARPEELPRLRAAREAAWLQARRTSLDPGSADPSARFVSIDEAFAQHDRAGRAVDTLVDALLAMARSVEELSNARRQLERHRADEADAARGLASSRQLVQDAEVTWSALWVESAVRPPAIDDASWRTEYVRFLAEVRSWSEATVDEASCARRVDEHRARLVASLGAPSDAPARRLDALLAQEISAADAARATLSVKTKALEKALKDRQTRGRTLTEKTTAFDAARVAFAAGAARRAPPVLSGDTAVAHWVEAVDNLALRAEALRKVVEQRDAHVDRLSRTLEELQRVLDALDGAGLDGVAALRQRRPVDQLVSLEAQLTEANVTRERERALQAAHEKLRACEARREELLAGWRAFLAEAGVEAELGPDSSACDALAMRLDRIAELEGDLAARRADARKFHPAPWDELVARVAGRDAAALETALADAKREESELDAQLVARRDALRLADEKVKAIEAGAGGRSLATVLQEREAAIEALVDELTEALALKGALSIIDQAQQELRQATALASVLEAASRHLARLTRGSFVRVEQAAEDGSRLFVVRGGEGGESLEASELSDGTRDQLWLALRLALINPHLAVKRVPLVLDDLLVHFDDERAAAALAAIAEVAKHTQVVLFTHHVHLVELARKEGLVFEAIPLEAPPVEGSVPAIVPLTPARPTPVRAPLLPGPVIRGPVVEGSDEAEFLRVLGEREGRAGNGALREALGWDEERYHATREALLGSGAILKGAGRGGSVRLAVVEGA